MALGLVRAFTDAGLQVPDDISVVGFDDIAGASHYLPPLTTVRQDFAALGELCVRLLMGRLAEEETPTTLVMAPELVVRSSATKPTRPPSDAVDAAEC
jgi:DNA-binding LacI/PurR family transcriptional regulator